jgi:hypothetical protein
MDARAFTTALAVLDAITGWYDSRGEELPERRYIYPGLLPAWDCEQLCVGVERIFNHNGNVAVETVESIGAQGGFSMRGALMAIWLVRCTPTVDSRGNPPSPGDMSDSAGVLLADQELMYDAIVDATRPTATLATCNGLAFVDWQTVQPTGGFVAGILRMRLSLI